MRKAAGIILIILGIFLLIQLISRLGCILSGPGIYAYLRFIILRIACTAFFVTGGVLCLERKYWRACLASASFGVSVGIFEIVEPLVVRGSFIMDWDIWMLVVAAVIATVLISLTKKEWQEISD